MLLLFRGLLQKIASRPKTLFLVDGLGAVLTAALLSVVLARFDAVVGLPRTTLYVLSAVALAFSVYSLGCYRAVTNWPPYLRAIAIANLSYCAATVTLLVYHSQTVTHFALAYFIGEVAIVVSLASVELMVVRRRATEACLDGSRPFERI